MARIAIENLTKLFATPRGALIPAVNNASLTVADRELVVLVGPSGCGKTTTLRLIAGLEQPTSGTVAIDGSLVNHIQPKDRDVAMVFQNYALYPQMSAYENMAFGLMLRKVSQIETERRVREMAEMLELAACLERKPHELSGGERQRVALGRALVHRPKALLLDEPLSGLDAQLRADTRAVIARLHARLGLTMLYVTHDQVEAMTLGQRIAVMNQGSIQEIGAPLRLYEHPSDRFVAGFFGSPPMNFFWGSIAANASGLCFQEQQIASCQPASVGRPGSFCLQLASHQGPTVKKYIGKQLVLGIRPEDIKLSKFDVPRQDCIEALAERIEPLGPEMHLYLASATHSFIARVPSMDGVPINAKISLVFMMQKAHFFDPATGKAIDPYLCQVTS